MRPQAAGRGARAGRRPEPAAPQSVRTTAETYLRRSGLSVARLGLLDQAWEALPQRPVGCTLEAVQRDTLFVRVKSPAHAHNLRQRTPGLLRELNKRFEKPWLRHIKAVNG